ncbi:unnamed protein product [Angiostrongylus costaricensis]|uniref:Hyaluronidase n=1 Tax=Angiostrongylus costaricensis TaxID=334426 RepID=A0A0R3PRX2_ANGCS|nr:unnamed protein product [Angiostrongylus costaricensis]
MWYTNIILNKKSLFLKEFLAVNDQAYSMNSEKLFLGHIFYGENVVIFYEHSFGLYPYFEKHNKNQPVNGGLPQNTDLKAHLVEVEKNITKLIPNENFTGFAVIDIEEWRPLFEQHFKNVKQVYQEASIDRVRANHPNLNDAETRQRAENEFNEAAKKFIVETMKTAKRMRPKALWGIYGIPFCNYNAGEKDGDYSCSARYKGFNEKEIKVNGNIIREEKSKVRLEKAYIEAILMESLRLVKKYNPSLLVYPYSKFEYDPLKKLDSFYSSFCSKFILLFQSDRCSTIDQPADLGIDGLILWSSSANMTKRCEKIKDYIETDLGP